MVSGFKRKASEEAASPESGQQIIKKARTDSPVKEVGGSTKSLRSFVLTSTPHRKMASLRNLHSALFHSLRSPLFSRNAEVTSSFVSSTMMVHTTALLS
ncbi:hypothetical protein ACN42_g11306 [Penicillium freii]|uniref:Uncharacterized protein n=1 Tax=Penicillium freii TaxID=48697 RepID=A0A101M8E0_PENFR|nr:hypothetical protein ACN42_g11306 [Penicillium freii]